MQVIYWNQSEGGAHVFNKKMFKAKCVEKGMSTRDIARILGINEATLYRKISGESDFTRNEIQIFRQALGLTSCEMDAIFFA